MDVYLNLATKSRPKSTVIIRLETKSSRILPLSYVMKYDLT